MRNYLNESGLSKILAIGGGLTGAALAGSDFMDTVNQGEHINPVLNPEASVNNTLDALGNAAKIPLYGLGGAIAGGIAGAGMNALINNKANNINKTNKTNKTTKTNFRRTPTAW